MPVIPPKPAVFAPDVPPPGFELNLVSFWQERPMIEPRLQLFHTNGASREGTVDSIKAWAERREYNGEATTLPHLQIDRTHDGHTRGALLLPSDRKGIANYQASSFGLGFETADTGYIDDPSISAFDAGQLELCAVAAAYYSILHDIPLAYPSAWDGAGSACHTEPFANPYWTKYAGKICPGDKKKAQVRDVILPRARAIRDAWLAPAPPPPDPPDEEDDMDPFKHNRIIRHDNRSYLWIKATNRKQWGKGDEARKEAWKALIRLAGGDPTTMQIDDADLFASMGPIEGTRSPYVDIDGIPKA